MQQVFTPLAGLYQCQLEASRRCADAIFFGTEKIDHIMLDATHRAVMEQLNFAKAVAGASGDPRTAGSLFQVNFLGRQSGDVVNYQKEIAQAVTEMQTEIGRSLQECMEQMRSQTPASGNTASSFSTAKASADTGNNPVTSIFSVWESAFKEVASLARTNMALAASAAESAIGQAAKAANSANASTNAASGAADAAYQTTRSAGEHNEATYEERSGVSPSPSNAGKKK